ncbi:peptidylprolyl isomerase [Paenibacillus sp. SYP-B3998]|uniref:Peptidyl-prolyl cis-trans isomerase n=2 Tax=Paenibacillus sp. SYP-B3998 TaxID=2678564 RepID=A0A6G3ZXX8_9BACL|nr:peptidylprolyl isomerase [Paenibacillus sp. SYP-B3998]
MKLLPLTLIALTVLVSACGNKPTESAGGTAAPKNGAVTSAAPAASATPIAPKQWTKAPDMTIDPKKSYQAEVTTSKGTFTIDLFADEAPKTVNNFVFLSKEGFYNNVTFHRIIKTFMIQTGDPQGTGMGGPGYKFEDELKTSHKYEPGIVAMANSGKNTNGSQFFICSGADCANLNKMPNYSIFGKVTDEGMATIAKIADTPVQLNPNGGDSSPSMPKEKVTINSITIKEK